ncbi:MAG TPA: TolC family protein [Candidatus Omnitrophota bacterium]|nr:TolC family protein [Candidatus Omnitrophota bacterium]HPN88104.1 TolC family protein [Candidatus Omnitrophota bacterium]
MKKINLFFVLFFLLCLFAQDIFSEEVLSWEQCLLEAKKNNPELISAVEVINQKKASQNVAGSNYFPQVSGSLATSQRGPSGTTKSYSYGVSATQLLFDGFKTTNSVYAAKENLNAARAAYQFTSSDVRLSLRTAFIHLLKAQELIKVAEEIVSIREDNWKLIELRYKSGLEHKGALLTAEANLISARAELSQAKRDVVLAQRQLTKAMGKKEFIPFFVQGDFLVRETILEKPDFEEIVKNDPSVIEAIARKNAAIFNLKSSQGNRFPKVSLSAGADRSSSQWPPQDEGWNAGVSLSVPLFEGGLKAEQIKESQALLKQAEANEQIVRDTTIVSLEQSWNALENALELVEVKRKSLEASQERSKIAQGQYSIGFIDFDNWIVIENDLVNAKKAFLESQANALLAEAKWIQAKGETLDYAL